jgi:hypothetical protein
MSIPIFIAAQAIGKALEKLGMLEDRPSVANPAVPDRKSEVRPAPLKIREVTYYRETGQHSTPIGTTTQVYDNRASSINISHNLIARKIWRQTVEVNLEELTAGSLKANVGLAVGPFKAGLEAEIQNSIKQTYKNSHEAEKTFEQNLSFDVPAGVMLTVLLKWKQIWQDGEMKLAFTNGNVALIPFSQAVEVSYDLETRTN